MRSSRLGRRSTRICAPPASDGAARPAVGASSVGGGSKYDGGPLSGVVGADGATSGVPRCDPLPCDAAYDATGVAGVGAAIVGAPGSTPGSASGVTGRASTGGAAAGWAPSRLLRGSVGAGFAEVSAPIATPSRMRGSVGARAARGCSCLRPFLLLRFGSLLFFVRLRSRWSWSTLLLRARKKSARFESCALLGSGGTGGGGGGGGGDGGGGASSTPPPSFSSRLPSSEPLCERLFDAALEPNDAREPPESVRWSDTSASLSAPGAAAIGAVRCCGAETCRGAGRSCRREKGWYVNSSSAWSAVSPLLPLPLLPNLVRQKGPRFAPVVRVGVSSSSCVASELSDVLRRSVE